MGRRILGFMYMGAQAWWHRFLLASGAGKLLWGLLPLMGACVFCSIVAAPFSSEDEPETEVRRDATPTVVPVTPTVAATTAVPTIQPTVAPEPTPATDAAALLPTAQPAVTEPPAPTEPLAPTAMPAVVTAAPTPEAAGPPRVVAPQAANVRVRDQPTAEGSTVIGALTPGESLTLRRVTPDRTWYAVETAGGLVGWVSATLLTVAPEIATQLPTGTTDEAIAVRPTAVPQQVPAPAAQPPASRGGTGRPIPTAVDTGSAPCQPGQIKGNRNSQIYHAPGQRDYGRTNANVQCFDTEAAAVAAGFRRAQR